MNIKFQEHYKTERSLLGSQNHKRRLWNYQRCRTDVWPNDFGSKH